jgi:hypothetical protein
LPDTAGTSITEHVGFIKNKLVNLPGRPELSQTGKSERLLIVLTWGLLFTGT